MAAAAKIPRIYNPGVLNRQALTSPSSTHYSMDTETLLHSKTFTETQVWIWVVEVMAFMAVVTCTGMWVAFRPAVLNQQKLRRVERD